MDKKLGTRLFALQLANLILISYGFIIYNDAVKDRTAVAEKVEEQYAEFEAENSSESGVTYIDGEYEGTAQGYGGDVVVKVTIKDGKIESVEATSHKNEDDAYFEAASQLMDKIVQKQSADINTVSGATFSSNGILGATKDALGKAVSEDEEN